MGSDHISQHYKDDMSAHIELDERKKTDEVSHVENNGDLHQTISPTSGLSSQDNKHSAFVVPQGIHDDALDILAQYGGEREITAEENKRVLRKIDWHLMPILCVIYWLQYYDKTTLSFASIFGIQKNANLHGKEYSWLGSIVYLAWYPTLPITAYIFVRFRLSIVVPTLVVMWGAILALMALAHNFIGLLIARFFLGVVECSVAPAFILMSQIWYRRSEAPWRNAIWYAQNAWVNIFGSLVAYGFGHIPTTKLFTYQWIFMLTGLGTVLIGIASFWLIPDNPAKNCRFLTEDEKVIAIERVRGNNQGVEKKEFEWAHVWEALTDLKTWGWMGLLMLISVPSGAVSTFGNLILQSFGFNAYQVLLLQIPFGAMQLIAIYGSFWAMSRFKTRSGILLLLMVPSIVASGMLYGLGRGKAYQAPLLVAYYLLAFYTPVTPIILSWQALNTSGASKKTFTTALAACGQSAGNVIGPLLFTSTEAPYYTRGLRAILIIFCLFAVMVVVVDANLYRLNKRNEKRRVAAGKPAKINDYSMMSPKEASEARALELEAARAGGFKSGANAFEGLTDQQNDEFQYVY